jgi:hypothetical protein
LLFDPVPGNLISSTRFLDLCSLTTANAAMDLSRCRHLHDVLALYPYLPLPDLAFHAQIFPKYPSDCHEVIEDACLGCHQGAVFCQPLPECRLSFTRIKDWLTAHGTTFNERYGNLVHRLNASHAECLEMMTQALSTEDHPGEVRYGHSKPSGAVIRRHTLSSVRVAGNGSVYLNKWHRQLVCESRGEEAPEDGARLLLQITR